MMAAGSPPLMQPLYSQLYTKLAIRPLSMSPLQGGIFSLRITFSGRGRQLPAASCWLCDLGEAGASAGTLLAQQLGLQVSFWWQEHEALSACTAAGSVPSPACLTVVAA